VDTIVQPIETVGRGLIQIFDSKSKKR